MTAYYITPSELSQFQTGIPWLQMFPNNGPQVQTWVCSTVSAMVDNICGEQVSLPTRPYLLRATVDTEAANTDTQEKTFVDDHGYLVYEATYRPIINVLSGTWAPLVGIGMTGGPSNAWDMTSVYWEKKEIVHVGLFDQYRYNPLRVSVSYLDGFANAVLTSPLTTSSTSMVVDDATGIQPGQVLNCYDLPTEPLTVAANFTPFTGPGTVALAANPTAAHATGVRVSAMGADLQQACILLAQHLMNTRTFFGQAPASQAMTPGNVPKISTNYYELALDLLDQYILTP